MKVKMFLFFLILQFSNAKYMLSQTRDSCGIYVRSVDFNILTWAAISCEKFTTSYLPTMKFRYIVNKDSLVMLDSFLKEVKFKKRIEGIDVRAQIDYIKTDNTRVSICMNSNAIMINGRSVKRNKIFFDFLRSMTY